MRRSIRPYLKYNIIFNNNTIIHWQCVSLYYSYVVFICKIYRIHFKTKILKEHTNFILLLTDARLNRGEPLGSISYIIVTNVTFLDHTPQNYIIFITPLILIYF